MANKRGFEHIIQVLGGLLIETSAGAGKVLTSDAEGNATWKAVAKKKYDTSHSWVWRRGEEVAAETIDGPVVVLASGEEQIAFRVDYKIASGTEVTFKLQRSGSDITGFTGLVAKTEAKHTEPTPVALTAGDEITLVVSSPVGTPKGLRVAFTIEHVA